MWQGSVNVLNQGLYFSQFHTFFLKPTGCCLPPAARFCAPQNKANGQIALELRRWGTRGRPDLDHIAVLGFPLWFAAEG